MLELRKICDVCVYGGGLILFFRNEVLNNDHSIPLGIRTRRPVHNHAIVSTADLESSTWFKTRGCYVAILPPLGSLFSISL